MAMSSGKSTGKRVLIAIIGTLIGLAIVAFVALQIAQREIKARVVAALGPLGSAESIDVGLHTIRLTHVVLKAPPGWPAGDPLHADEVILTPDLVDFLHHKSHMQSVVVRGFDMAVLRTADGSLRVLPNLRQSLNSQAVKNAAAPDIAPTEKQIDHVAFENGSFQFYDQSVEKTPYHVTVSNAQATLDNLHLPALDTQTNVSVTGGIKGPQHTGTVAFNGWIRVSSRDSETTTALHGIDIAVLDPYLTKKAGASTRVTGGTIDLSVQTTVRNYQLHAPGTLTLHNLQLAESDNPLDTFMSIPTRAAIAALKTHNGDVTVHFTLDGNLHDPKFSVRDSLMRRLGAGLASALGVSAEGVAKGAGDTVKGIGNALKSLLGQ